MLYFPELFSFNTSHVVIYHFIWCHFYFGFLFQYISCCYLSNLHSYILEQKTCFNTSHVVIYHKMKRLFISQLMRFQYISCCYLSSNSPKKHLHNCVSIHLMLLFIEVVLSCIRQKYLSFNTSHVVIYLNADVKENLIYRRFQYISCCYLSNNLQLYKKNK